LSRSQQLTATTFSLTMLTVFLWAGNPVATSFSTDVLPPVAVSGIRFLLATIFMLGWCMLERAPLALKSGQFRPVLIAGTLLALQIWTFTLGVAWSSSSHSSLLINSYVFFVVVCDHFVTRQYRLGYFAWGGFWLAMAGVTGLILSIETSEPKQKDLPTLAGDLVTLFSAFLFAAKLLYSKQALKVIGSTQLIFWHDVVAVVLFALLSFSTEHVEWHKISTSGWLALVYQGFLVGGLCFGLQTWLLKWHSASQIAIFSFLTPLMGIALASMLRGDQLTPAMGIAGACIAIGIVFVQLDQKSS
jgi:drug/metabolite transporter (DMT)-like permease